MEKPVNCKLQAVNVGSFPATKQAIPKGEGNYFLWYWWGDVRTLDKFKKEAPPSFALLFFFLFFLHLLEFVSMLVRIRNVQRE